MRDIKIKDLRPLPGTAHSAARPRLRGLSDDELLEAVLKPRKRDFLKVDAKTGVLLDGNGRAYELLCRAADPNSGIDAEMTVPVEEYIRDDSMFPDLD